MVLVDTSVWIRFLANRPPYAAGLDRLLALDQVAGHELVYGELLIGDRGGRGKLLVSCHVRSVGYKRRSLIRASRVVNCQSIPEWALFR